MSFLSKLGLAVAGPIVGGLFSSHSAKKQAQQNADLSRENWIYQQSNAHQLEVQDLKNAGLNPILSATNSQMAGMSPVQGSDPANFGSNLTNALQGALERQSKQELQANDLEIEKMKLENEKLRTQIQRDEADAQISKWHSEGKLLDIQADYTSSKKLNEHNESVANVQKVFSDIFNNKQITEATVKQLNSGTALNYQQIEGIKKQMLKAVAEANLTDEQRAALHDEITGGVRQLRNKRASYQGEFLDSWFGKLMHQFGFGLQLVNPFTGFAEREGNTSVSMHK